MRICPKCGFHDSPCWRPRANRPYCEYSNVDNIGYSEPELIQEIRGAAPNPFYDGHFVYHITKSGRNVERIELEYYKFMRWVQSPRRNGICLFLLKNSKNIWGLNHES